MQIRDATSADAALLLDAAVRLTVEAGGGVADVRIELDQLRRDLDGQVARALVAETPPAGSTDAAAGAASAVQTGGQVAGIAFYSFVHFSLSGLHVYLDDLYVEPGFRNAGLGRRLMAALADRGLQRGCVGMTWQVEHDNRDGIRFYERLGARLAGDRRVMMVGDLSQLAKP